MSENFNKAVVVGVIEEISEVKETRSKGTLYVDVKLRCKSEQYGNILAFGKVWGKAAQSLHDYHERMPGSLLRFYGIYGQYMKDDQLRSQFTLFQWEPVDPDKLDKQDREPRAAFILIGQLVSVDISGPRHGWSDFLMKVLDKNGNAKELHVYVNDKLSMTGVAAGKIVQINGHIANPDIEWGGGRNVWPVASGVFAHKAEPAPQTTEAGEDGA